MDNPDDLFLKVVGILNSLFMVMCFLGILAGLILILRRKRWGYYIIFVALAGIVVHMIFRG